MNTKALALLVAILGLALSSCGGEPQTQGEPATSELPAPGAGEAATNTGSQTEESVDLGGSGETLILEIGGYPGTEFFGTCAVGGGESEELDGRTPESFTYDLEGKPLECEIASESAVEVILTHHGTRSVQRFGGGTLNLTYENGSISTSSNSSSTSSSQVVSSSGGSG